MLWGKMMARSTVISTAQLARKCLKVSKIVLQKKLIETTLLIDCLNITAMWIQLAFLQNDFEHF